MMLVEKAVVCDWAPHIWWGFTNLRLSLEVIADINAAAKNPTHIQKPGPHLHLAQKTAHYLDLANLAMWIYAMVISRVDCLNVLNMHLLLKTTWKLQLEQNDKLSYYWELGKVCILYVVSSHSLAVDQLLVSTQTIITYRAFWPWTHLNEDPPLLPCSIVTALGGDESVNAFSILQTT